jgi:hypothetical protein
VPQKTGEIFERDAQIANVLTVDEAGSVASNHSEAASSFSARKARGKIGGWTAGDVPITRATDSYIWFKNKPLSDTYSEGTLDRITGSLHLFHRFFGHARDFYLQCKPAKPLF